MNDNLVKGTKNTSILKTTGDKKSSLKPINEEHFRDLDLLISETEQPTLIKNVFIPTWDNKPPERKAIVSLNDVSILTNQNTSMIIAQPGMGKSSICESIAANIINPTADCLGFKVANDCEGIISIDNERTQDDVWESFSRYCRRAGVPHGTKIEKLIMAGLRAIPKLDERLKTIEWLLSNHPCGLLLIDGLGDLVTDPNDQLQAIDCRIWLRETTSKYNVSIITTIHPNPGSDKPRGHVGSEGLRESECVLLAKKYSDEIRIITTEFEYGKNRNNTPITTAYRWSDDVRMFVSADADSVPTGKAKDGAKKLKAENIAMKVLPAPLAKTRTDLEESIMEVTGQKESTADRLVKSMIEYGFIKKHDDGLYRAIV